MLKQKLLRARILLVDDEDANLKLLSRILEPEGYKRLRTTTDPEEALELFDQLDPDLVLLDLLMPKMDGFEVLKEIRERTPEGTYLPVLILTSDHSQQAKRKGLEGGANDFLTKPLSPTEVRLRVKNLLETRFLHRALQNQNELLEARVRERTRDLESARMETLYRLARAAEYRDDQTGEHTRRVGRASGEIAMALGMSAVEVELIEMVAPLHDVGKIGVPDQILLSPDPLSDEEFEVMKTHTRIGGDLLGGSEFPLLRAAAEVARTHHERWDGAGYPDGLGGSDIPLMGRIVALADTFDALMHQRPYKEAWTLEQTLTEIEESREAHFDPDVVDAFRSTLLEAGEHLRAG